MTEPPFRPYVERAAERYVAPMNRYDRDQAIGRAGSLFFDDHGVLPTPKQMGQARKMFFDLFAPPDEGKT